MNINVYKDQKLSDANIAIIRSRFNEVVTGRMLDACISSLKEAGLTDDKIHVIEVPGAFEIPLATHAASKKDFDAVITLGCVMRGETPHDRYISHAVIEKLQDISLESSKPIILGVITPLDQAQADKRSDGEHNKGVEAALSAVEMIHVMRSFA
jgi:6,7-dimethyl-8-ribityllumazine synthase